MRIAFVSDTHANLEAVSACLEHARGNDAGQLVFLGDLVGYGADPGPVVDNDGGEAARLISMRGRGTILA
jgi:predicted phosphodiesterase